MQTKLYCRGACVLSLLVLLFGPVNAADNGTIYHVVADESELHVLVFRAGALGGLGHNHIITSHGITGTVTVGPSATESSIDLTMPVDSLVVDDPEARAAAGSVFESEVDDEDRQGTRENMMSSQLLHADEYDYIKVTSERISGDFPNMTVHAQITIKGSKHEVDLPVSATIYGDRLIATGRTDVSHSQLGLEPFSAAFGTLRVDEDLTLRYRIVAVREAGTRD